MATIKIDRQELNKKNSEQGSYHYQGKGVIEVSKAAVVDLLYDLLQYRHKKAHNS